MKNKVAVTFGTEDHKSLEDRNYEMQIRTYNVLPSMKFAAMERPGRSWHPRKLEKHTTQISSHHTSHVTSPG